MCNLRDMSIDELEELQTAIFLELKRRQVPKAGTWRVSYSYGEKWHMARIVKTRLIAEKFISRLEAGEISVSQYIKGSAIIQRWVNGKWVNEKEA